MAEKVAWLAGAVSESVHGFMVWNLFLAFVPVVLAVALFRRRARPSPLWWAGVATWVAFLPNAPYVLADVIHLVDDLQATRTDLHTYVVLACYAIFFALGVGAYVFSLDLLQRFLVRCGRAALVVPVLVVLHAMSAFAMYIGRFVRLNSWDIVLAPGSVAASLQHVVHRFPIVVMLTTFVTLAAVTFVLQAATERMLHVARRLHAF